MTLHDQLKAEPALAADPLAEGRRSMAKKAADAASAPKRDLQFFKDGGWEFGRSYWVRSPAAGRYQSRTCSRSAR